MAVLLRDGPERAVLPGDRTSAPATTPATAAQELLEDLGRAWSAGDVAAARVLASQGHSSRRGLTALTRNIVDLGISQLSLRYVTEADAPASVSTDGELPRLAVTAQLTWRLDGFHDAASTLEVPMLLEMDGEVARFVSLPVEAGSRVPLWLQQRVAVRRSSHTLVISTRRDTPALVQQVNEAWRTVRRTLPDWDGSLVVEAPRTSQQFERAAGMDADAASAIAAITTTADGSSSADSAVQVYLNPPVFDPLGRQGRQIVLSHEATHVAMDALTEAAPYWLSEGFADYVALVDTELPTSVLAAQILALVREDGPPSRLPGSAEFDGASEDIGAWYEAAWLAARLIADRYGEPALFELYERAVKAGERAAFRQVLGMTRAEFTKTWAAHLEELAR